MERVVWPRAILHLDMDAFFVNVHILENPEHKDIPLAVGGKPGQRGVIASASYEARAKGVRSAMASSKALKLCPELKLVSSNRPMIRSCSKKVMEILARYGTLERMSVDEAFVDLSHVEEKEVDSHARKNGHEYPSDPVCSSVHDLSLMIQPRA